MRRIDEAHEGALGIGVGNDGSGENLFTRREHNASGDAVFHPNLGDVGSGANFSARLFRRGSHCESDGADATSGELSTSGGRWIGGGTQHQHERAAGRPRAEGGSEDAAGGDGGAQGFGVEELGDQIGNSHRSPAQDAIQILLAEISNGPARPEHAPKIATAGTVDIRRRERERFADDLADFTQRCSEVRVRDCVFLRPLRDFLRRLFLVGVEDEGPAVG